ncbi:hypothetical protein J4436_01665 [Candidatus Woesearchaeota archaeon]|nr:hypothetical protein [Candidatus Woesearchaeota archaeon]
MQYIIYHLEKKLYPWVLIEYIQISKYVGKNNLIFMNIKKDEKNILKKFGKVNNNLKITNAVILDPKAKKHLTIKDKKFSYCIFGGILGDNPPQNRTKIITKLHPSFKKRNLGNKQMSIDTAVLTTKLILNNKKIEFIDDPEIELGIYESVILPYRYIKRNNKPVIAKALLKYLKKKEDI